MCLIQISETLKLSFHKRFKPHLDCSVENCIDFNVSHSLVSSTYKSFFCSNIFSATGTWCDDYVQIFFFFFNFQLPKKRKRHTFSLDFHERRRQCRIEWQHYFWFSVLGTSPVNASLYYNNNGKRHERNCNHEFVYEMVWNCYDMEDGGTLSPISLHNDFIVHHRCHSSNSSLCTKWKWHFLWRNRKKGKKEQPLNQTLSYLNEAKRVEKHFEPNWMCKMDLMQYPIHHRSDYMTWIPFSLFFLWTTCACELNQSVENVANNMACQCHWCFSEKCIFLFFPFFSARVCGFFKFWNCIESVSMFCQFELLSTHNEANIAYNFIRVTNDSMRFIPFSFMSHSWNVKCLSRQCEFLYSKFIKGVIGSKRRTETAKLMKNYFWIEKGIDFHLPSIS